MPPKKYYVVWRGFEPGVYDFWLDCKKQIDGFENAQYKSFPNHEEAIEAFRSGPQNYIKRKTVGHKPSSISSSLIIKDSLSVDAACSGNPGKMEYRGVHIGNGTEIFKMGPFDEGTNNIGEFLALVHGLALLKKQNSPIPIYSDSVNAISWVKNKKCKTKLEENEKNKPVFELIKRAENWLNSNTYSTVILKWETKDWGEIPADFGRK